jgi:hypothetical protein
MTHVFTADVWLCDIAHSIRCEETIAGLFDSGASAAADTGSGVLSSTAADAAASAAGDAGTSGLLSSTAADAAAGGAGAAAPVAIDSASSAAGLVPGAADAAGLATASLGGQDAATLLGIGQPAGAAGAIAPAAALDPVAAVTGTTPIAPTAAPAIPVAQPVGAAPLGSGGPGAGSITAPAAVQSGGAATGDFGKDPDSLLNSGKSASNFDTGASAAIAPAKASGLDEFLAHPVDKIGSGLVNNPGAVLGAGILGVEALNQPSIPGANTAAGSLDAAAKKLSTAGSSLIAPNAAAVGKTAGNLSTQGSTIANDAAAGKLPAGLEQQLATAASSAKATIRSQYASRGMSGSSAEQQDLANVDNQIAAQRGTLAQSLLQQGINEQTQGASLANNLLQTGISETGLSTALYEAILKQSLGSDQALSDALAKFATGLAGGGGGQTFKISSAA